MSTCRAHCVRCGLCFGGSEAFERHITALEHRHPSEIKRLEGRPGTCAYTSFPAAEAGAAVYHAALDKARRVSRLAGRKGDLSREELAGVIEASRAAEVGLPQHIQIATTVWSQPVPTHAGAITVAGHQEAFDA